jgi:hypothetical protein
VSLLSGIQAIPSLWEDLDKHVVSVITDLLNMDDARQADEIARMALSFYSGDEGVINRTIPAKYIDVSIRITVCNTVT